MMEAPVQLPAKPLRLRVLSGRLSGAEHRLPAGRSVTVGHSFENDVVLRGRGTAGLSAELHMSEDATMLRVLSGSVLTLGRELGAGEELLLPSYLPVRLGEFACAVGGEDDARWAEAGSLTASVAQPITPERTRPRADWAERLAARLDRLRFAVRHRLRLVMFCLVALLGVTAAVPLADYWRDLQTRDPASIKRRLAAIGYPGLTVASDPNGGGVLISGGVVTDRDVDRVQAFAAQRFPESSVEVESAAALASAATDILRQNGIAVEAKPLRPGVIGVTGDWLPVDRRRELTALLRRDLPGLRRVDYATASGRGSDELRYFFNSPQYGAASFVDGEPGFIVTADGSRWFAGATLPTGHRIINIGRGRVTLEREGQVEVLTM